MQCCSDLYCVFYCNNIHISKLMNLLLFFICCCSRRLNTESSLLFLSLINEQTQQIMAVWLQQYCNGKAMNWNVLFNNRRVCFSVRRVIKMSDICRDFGYNHTIIQKKSKEKLFQVFLASWEQNIHKWNSLSSRGKAAGFHSIASAQLSIRVSATHLQMINVRRSQHRAERVKCGVSIFRF